MCFSKTERLNNPWGESCTSEKKKEKSYQNHYEGCGGWEVGWWHSYPLCLGFPGGSEVKASAWNAGDPAVIPGSGRSPGGGHSCPLQYSCLENSMDRGVCRLQPMGLRRVRNDWSNFAYTQARMLDIQESNWDFHSGPVVKTPCFHCWEHGFNLWLGN